MNSQDVLELQNMFTMAAQLAKSRNKVEFHLQIDEAAMIELVKKAFPAIKDETQLAKIARSMLKTDSI